VYEYIACTAERLTGFTRRPSKGAYRELEEHGA
jgi:hypothetical protein